MMRTAAVRNIPEIIANSIVHTLVFSGKGNRKKNTRLYIIWKMLASSRKARKLGIRFEMRWLSIILTAPKAAALNIAVLIQLNRVKAHFRGDTQPLQLTVFQEKLKAFSLGLKSSALF